MGPQQTLYVPAEAFGNAKKDRTGNECESVITVFEQEPSLNFGTARSVEFVTNPILDGPTPHTS